MSDPPDEFEWIARSLAPLTEGAPEALGLIDDAAVIPARPGYDLVVSKDAIVAGVHFLPTDPPDLVARKLLRVNLSDLAAKGAAPYGYFLAIAWPPSYGRVERQSFAHGLAQDQARFELKLFGGDTVATPGPLVASATILGWVPAGRMIQRVGAKVDDVLLVSGSIGNGFLGLRAAKGEWVRIPNQHVIWLADRWRLPRPRLGLGSVLRACVHAAADVSDGLVADAAKVAMASGIGLDIDLDKLPLSEAAAEWVASAADPVAARIDLATGGDDYEIVCLAPRASVSELQRAAADLGAPMTEIGSASTHPGVRVYAGGRQLDIARTGYVHH